MHRRTAIAIAAGIPATCLVGCGGVALTAWWWWHRDPLGAYRVYRGHKEGIACLAFDESSEIVASGGPDGLHFWRVSDGERIERWPGHVLAFRYVRGQRKLVCADAETGIYVLDLQRQRVERTFGRPAHWIALDVSADGKQIAASFADYFSERPLTWTKEDFAIHVWSSETGQENKLLGHSGPVTAVAFHPKEPRLLSLSWDRTLRYWNLETGEQLAMSGEPYNAGSFSGGYDAPAQLAVDREGVRCLVGGSMRHFGAAKPRPRRNDSTLPIAVSGCFSMDDRSYAKGYQDGTVRIFDLATRREIACVLAFCNNAPIEALAFSPDGRLLATGGRGQIGGFDALGRGVPAIDQAVRLWRLPDIG